MFGLNLLELIETAAGSFYCYQLGIDTVGFNTQNLKVGTTPEVRFEVSSFPPSLYHCGRFDGVILIDRIYATLSTCIKCISVF